MLSSVEYHPIWFLQEKFYYGSVKIHVFLNFILTGEIQAMIEARDPFKERVLLNTKKLDIPGAPTVCDRLL